MILSEGARIDTLREKALELGLALSTDQLRESLALASGDVKAAAKTLDATQQSMEPAERAAQEAPICKLKQHTSKSMPLRHPQADLGPVGPTFSVRILVVVGRGQSILVGKVLRPDGTMTIHLPDGILGFNESFDDSARRVVRETTGLLISSTLRHAATTNNPVPADVSASCLPFHGVIPFSKVNS